MENINIEIDFHDPNLYVVGGSVIAVIAICMYYICNHRCSDNTESEIELTSSQDNLQNFNNVINNTEIDLESQQTTQSTQTEDIEFFNMLGSQFNKDINSYMKNNKRNIVYEYESD